MTNTMATYGSGTGPRAQQALRDQHERNRLAEDLARWAGDEADRAHDADVASLREGRHYTYCCEQARESAERDEYRFALALPLDKLRKRWLAGLEERALYRARRAGLI